MTSIRREVAIDILHMLSKQNTTCLFSGSICSIKTRGNILEGKNVAFDPVSSHILMDFNTVLLFGRLSSMYHEKGSILIFIKKGGIVLWSMDFISDGKWYTAIFLASHYQQLTFCKAE